MNGKRRLLGSFWHGSMANAMAQAIGAQSAFPGRQVVSLSGDGGFAMLMGDFLSLTQLDLPVKVVVFNNGALGFIELEQKSTGFLATGTELQNPNFAAMAEAVGIRGIRLEDPGDVEAGIAAAFAHDGPVLVDAVVNRTELAMPPAVTAEMAKGFTLYMVKAVMSGRADEISISHEPICGVSRHRGPHIHSSLCYVGRPAFGMTREARPEVSVIISVSGRRFSRNGSSGLLLNCGRYTSGTAMSSAGNPPRPRRC